MTSYIVDASVISEWLLDDAYTPNAEQLMAGITRGDEYHIPEIGLVECTNVIWQSVRLRGMPPSDGQIALKNLTGFPFKRAAVKNLLKPALTIGLRNNLAIYDSIYIALAMKLEYPLVTLDVKQSRAATAEGVQVIPITSFTP